VPYFDAEPSKDLSIIIVSYNVKPLLKDCLNSIVDSTRGIDYEVIVIDNNSHDGSIDLVKNEFPGVIRIAEQKNLGFVKANNVAFRQSKGKYILMLNPDTVVVENAFGKMIDYFESNPNVGALGCKMLFPDKTLQPSCYNFPTLREIFGMYFVGGNHFSGLKNIDYDKCQEVDFVRGAFLALRRRCLEKIGMLDENIFMFAEETDLCYRMIKNGYSVMYWPEMVIIHHKSKSVEQFSDKMYVQRIRSLIYFFNKNYGIFRTLLLRVIIFTGVGLRLLFRKYFVNKSRQPEVCNRSNKSLFEVLKLSMGLNQSNDIGIV
jgi:GT2 family glycosyltransferase